MWYLKIISKKVLTNPLGFDIITHALNDRASLRETQTNLENDTEKKKVKLRCEDAAGRLRSAEAERAGSERVLREKQSEF